MIKIAIAFAIIVAAALAYIRLVRPILEKMGWVKPIDGSIFERIWTHARGSLTILWGYLLQFGGIAIEGAALIDKEQVREALAGVGLGEWFGAALFVIGLLTVMARIRTATRDV